MYWMGYIKQGFVLSNCIIWGVKDGLRLHSDGGCGWLQPHLLHPSDCPSQQLTLSHPLVCRVRQHCVQPCHSAEQWSNMLHLCVEINVIPATKKGFIFG